LNTKDLHISNGIIWLKIVFFHLNCLTVHPTPAHVIHPNQHQVEMAAQASAPADNPIQVLIALHEKFDLMDFAGPVEVFHAAQHDPNDPGTSPSPLSPLHTVIAAADT